MIGIDAGTSDLRAVVFDKFGNEVAQTRTAYPTLISRPGWAEQDANDWEKALISSIRSLFSQHNINPDNVKAIGITHQRETFVPVDEKGNPLRAAILWFDTRAKEQVEWLKEQIDPLEIQRITGVPVSTGWSMPKILWVRDNQKEIFRNTHKFLLVSDFLTFKLVGEFNTSWASACTSQLFDINSFKWSKKLLDICDIPITKLPNTISPGQTLGSVSKRAADSMSLPEGLPVIAGGGDQQCGGLGTGVIKTGISSLNLGTSVILETFLDKPIIDYQNRYWLRVACVPGKYMAENGIIGGAYTLKWFKENFGHYESEVADQINLNPYDIMTLEAKKAPPASLGLMLVPYWLGATSDSDAKGIIVGFMGYHKREHLIRAILEGVAYEVRQNMEGMEQASKKMIEEIRVYGGGAKSDLWCQIIADICDKEVKVTQTEENTALGAAILAATSCFYSNVYEAVENMIQIKSEYHPIKENVKLYDSKYNKVYKNLYKSLQHLFKEIA